MVGVAVNVADAPEHCGFVPVVRAIETDAGNAELTFIVIVLELALTELEACEKYILGLIEPVFVIVADVQAPDPAVPSLW